jgi:hypothetical protein
MWKKYLSILILFTLSCNPENNGLFQFDPRIIKENEIKLSEIADEIIYIPLDNSFPIGLIYNDIILINNSIYFSTNDNGILVYDKKGKFVCRIGSKGRGPGEYSYCYQITVDDKTETIYNMDQNEIKVYSKFGNFVRKISLQKYGGIVNTFESFNSNLFVSFLLQSGDSKYDWIILDTLGSLIKAKKRSIPLFTSDWLISGETYKYGNQMFYWDHFTDTVFSILPDLNEKPAFIISPGDHRMPRSNFSFEEHEKYLNLKQIFETDHFLLIRYHYLEPALVLIDKKNNESFLTCLEGNDSGFLAWGLSGGIINDLDGGLKYLPNNKFVEKTREYLIGLLNPYQIKIRVASSEFINSTPKYPEKKKELEKLANSLKETDNPVLILVRLKK